MDAAARDQLILLLDSFSEKLPILKKRKAGVLRLCKQLGKVLRRAGILFIECAKNETVHISWRGVFYRYVGGGGDCFTVDLTSKACIPLVRRLPEYLDAMEHKVIDKQKALDSCSSFIHTILERTEKRER